MRTALVLLCGVALLAATGLPADARQRAEWQKASLNGNKVEVQFPGKPTEKSGKGSTQLLLEVPGGKAVYIAMANELGKAIDVSNKDIVKKILDGGRDGGVRSMKGTLENEKDVKQGKYPGRQFDIKSALGIYRTRIYLSGDHLYQVTLLGPKEFVDSADAKKFLDSLKFSE